MKKTHLLIFVLVATSILFILPPIWKIAEVFFNMLGIDPDTGDFGDILKGKDNNITIVPMNKGGTKKPVVFD